MSDRIGLRTSQNIPEFSSAWMRAYDAHVSEVKGACIMIRVVLVYR